MSNLKDGQKSKMAKLTMTCLFALLVLIGGLFQTASAAEKGPIKIGFVAPLTGHVPNNYFQEIDKRRSYQLLLEQKDYSHYLTD